MKDFKKLLIWEKGINIVEQVYSITKTLPDNERFGLISQMNRCAVSIPSNIAEGSSRDSTKDHKHFLRIALGSCFELETQLIIVERLGMLENVSLDRLKKDVDEEEKMIMSFMKRLS